MKISCPTCSAKYSIADEKVQNRLAKIRCRKCGTYAADATSTADGEAAVAPAAFASASTASASTASSSAASTSAASTSAASAPVAQAIVYTVDLGENDQRQMSIKEIVAAYNSAQVTAETYIWTDGFADWTPLGQVDVIVAALHAAVPAHTAPAANAAQVSSPSLDEASAVGASTHVDDKPWDSGPSDFSAARSAAGPRSGGGPDLFGAVSHAGSEPDGVSMGTASNPFSGANTGARNESSVLFSLSALTSSTASSRPSVPAPAAYTANNDDSGLIDLKALTATAQAMSASAAIPMAPVPAMSPFAGASPLGGPSPLSVSGLGRSSLGPMPAPKNNTGLIIGVSIILAALGVAAIVTFGGSEEQPIAPPAPAVAAAPIALPQPSPQPVASPAPGSDAKPPATGTEEETKAPARADKKSSGTARPKTSSSPASSPGPSASPAPAPKPKASSGKCGCASGDLMCLMNCAK